MTHTHEWKRLYTRPNEADTGRRLTYVLAGWERVFVCTVEGCGQIAKKAHQTGRMRVLLMQEFHRQRAEEWNREERALKERAT